MARYARLLCVLGVLCFSTSAFATIIDAVPDTENDTILAPQVLDLTIGRVGITPWTDFGFGLATSATDVDLFKVDLIEGDYLMVNTSIINPALATVVTLYDSTGTSVVAGGTDAAAYIDNVSSAEAGTYYIGVTGDGAGEYMITAAIDNHLPEPTTMAILAIGGAGMLIRRRRNR